MVNPEKLPAKGPCFFYGNHSNMLDPFILNCFTPWGDPTGGVLTQEFFRGGFLKWALTQFDVHPARKRLTEPHLIKTIYRMLDRGRKIVIYPEGGSRWSGTPLPWIESTAKIFVKSGVPIYPIIMRGSYASWPRWATYPRRAQIEIEVADPIQLPRNTPLEDALSAFRKPIDFDGCIVPDRLKPKRAYKPADGIHKLIYRDPETGVQDAISSPDGKRVISSTGALDFEMLSDSSLKNPKTGELTYTSALYDRIKALPLIGGTDGSLLYNNIDLSTESEFPNLEDHGPADIRLFVDHIAVRGSRVRRDIPLVDLVGLDIERSFKLQLFVDGEMIQFSFNRGGSALGWKDAIEKLIGRR